MTYEMKNELLIGDCRSILPTLPERSVQCVITSPTYYNLRDYCVEKQGAHFAAFPIELIIPCILAGSKEDDIVLDPFFGSGTVAEAAKNLNRR